MRVRPLACFSGAGISPLTIIFGLVRGVKAEEVIKIIIKTRHIFINN